MPEDDDEMQVIEIESSELPELLRAFGMSEAEIAETLQNMGLTH